MTWETEMTLGNHVQVWMFPGRAWDKEDTGSAWTWLMEVEWVVASIVKVSLDGALSIRTMSLGVCFLKGSCTFQSQCLNDVQLV